MRIQHGYRIAESDHDLKNQKLLEDYKQEKTLEEYEQKAIIDATYSKNRPGKGNNNPKSNEYSHLTMLSDATAGQIEDYTKTQYSNIVVGKNADGSEIKTKILYNNGRHMLVVEDSKGNLKGAKNSYRELSQSEKQAYVLNVKKYTTATAFGKRSWETVRVKDQNHTFNDYIKQEIETNPETQQRFIENMLDDCYTVSGIMTRAYGSPYDKDRPNVNLDDATKEAIINGLHGD